MFGTITLQVIVVKCLFCIPFDDFVIEENEINAYYLSITDSKYIYKCIFY